MFVHLTICESMTTVVFLVSMLHAVSECFILFSISPTTLTHFKSQWRDKIDTVLHSCNSENKLFFAIDNREGSKNTSNLNMNS